MTSLEMLETLLGFLVMLGVAVLIVKAIALRKSRKGLEGTVRRIYQEGRQSVLDGICSGTSLDDAYVDGAVEQILERLPEEAK